MGIISVAIRSGICIGAVKWTADQGVWGDANRAIDFKQRTCEAVNGNQHVQTGKAHFQTYVPLPEVKTTMTSHFQTILTFLFSFRSFHKPQKLDSSQFIITTKQSKEPFVRLKCCHVTQARQ